MFIIIIFKICLLIEKRLQRNRHTTLSRKVKHNLVFINLVDIQVEINTHTIVFRLLMSFMIQIKIKFTFLVLETSKNVVVLWISFFQLPTLVHNLDYVC